MSTLRVFVPLALCVLLVPLALADGPKDNTAENVRPIPPKGVAVPPADAAELRKGLTELQTRIKNMDIQLKHAGFASMIELLPDVAIYEKAVRYALDYDEFFAPKEIATAKKLLKDGIQRAKELAAHTPSWPTATGLVVRGYRSKIDGSVQPYGLVVPASFAADPKQKRRLDVWWHGRGETLSEVNFIQGRQTKEGEFTPENAFVLHPYGRYSNANKFAGEIDTFECLEHAKKHYAIDENRLVARGFSMGGAACWQFATHYPTLWCAANPGAGFAETPEFLNVFQSEKVEPTWYEKKLWHMYNAADYAQNIFNVPTVAYSGEIDKQKQAADVMAREMKKVGLELTHIIGPKTAHKYEPGAKKVVAKLIDDIVAKGKDPFPKKIKFVTYTLRYNQCEWLSIERMEKHWAKAHAEASVDANGKIIINTSNVSLVHLSLPGTWRKPEGYWVTLNGKSMDFNPAGYSSGVPYSIGLFPNNESNLANGLAKIHGLQGPIDDAFMDAFLMVKPTGAPLDDKVGAWAKGEMQHAVTHWRRHFRGDAIVKDDTAVSDADIAGSNLVLWGDPSSNAVLAKIADKLPIKWTKDGITVGDKTYAVGTHVPLLIYPNPLNPKKYVVLNSGFTFREYDYLNNARQTPKLPDYAVIDVTTPPDSRHPGKVVRAGFFGEKWELQADDGRGIK